MQNCELKQTAIRPGNGMFAQGSPGTERGVGNVSTLLAEAVLIFPLISNLIMKFPEITCELFAMINSVYGRLLHSRVVPVCIMALTC